MISSKKRGTSKAGLTPGKPSSRKVSKTKPTTSNFGAIAINEILFQIAEYCCSNFIEVVRFTHAFRVFRNFLLEGVESAEPKRFVLEFLKGRPLTVRMPRVGHLHVTPKYLCQILKSVVYTRGIEISPRRFRVKWLNASEYYMDARCEETRALAWSIVLTSSDPLKPLIQSGCDPLSLDIREIFPLVTPEILAQCKNLEELKIANVHTFRPVVGELTRLASLGIYDHNSCILECFGYEEDTTRPEKWTPYNFEKLINLKSLTIDGFTFYTEWLRSAPTSVTSLTIKNGDHLDSSDIKHLLGTLKEFAMEDTDTLEDEEDEFEIIDGLNEDLKSLTLCRFTSIKDSEFKKFRNLEKLVIKNGPHPDYLDVKTTLKLTDESLQCFTKLKELRLQCCSKITAEGVSSLTELKHLDIELCPRFAISESLSRLKKLREVRIVNCSLVIQSASEIRCIVTHEGTPSKIKIEQHNEEEACLELEKSMRWEEEEEEERS